MRAVFNNSAVVYSGLATPTPGVELAVVPCRYVPETRQTPITEPLIQRTGYVTLDEYSPNGPLVTGGTGTYVSDYGWSDLLAIPPGNAKLYQVLFTEVLVPYFGGPYVRSHVRTNPDLGILSQEDLGHLLQEDGGLLLVTE